MRCTLPLGFNLQDRLSGVAMHRLVEVFNQDYRNQVY